MKTWFEHLNEIHACLLSTNDTLIERAAHLISSAQLILTAGNGGSAALASHAAQAFMKPSYVAGNGLPAICLTDSMPTLTAHANDGGWQSALLETAWPFFKIQPVLLLISSSGKSENIVTLANAACEALCPIIALTGFSGGPLRDLATIPLHIESNDYEVVEPVHDVLLHRIQYHIRKGDA